MRLINLPEPCQAPRPREVLKELPGTILHVSPHPVVRTTPLSEQCAQATPSGGVVSVIFSASTVVLGWGGGGAGYSLVADFYLYLGAGGGGAEAKKKICIPKTNVQFWGPLNTVQILIICENN